MSHQYLIHDNNHNSTHEIISQEIQLNPRIVNRFMRNMVIYYSILTITSVLVVTKHTTPTNCGILFSSWLLTMSVMYLTESVMYWVRYIHRTQEHTPCGRSCYRYFNLAFLVVSGLGHVLLIHNYSCSNSNPWLYYYSLFVLLHNYLILICLFGMWILYLMCLPCFLWLIRPIISQRGLTTKHIQSLPTMKYSDIPVKNDTGTLACPVCLEDFVATDQVIQLPCQHIFHQPCLVEWLKINAICPLCRGEVMGNPNSV